ncbi:MAG: hemerythrin domain-containing protein [Pseudomonadota bacterium]
MSHDDMRVRWRDSFSVGDALIDAQHREFFDEVNRVSEALEGGEGREAVIAFYRVFVAGLDRHFRDEEELLARIRFPDIDIHRSEHQALMAAVTAVEGLLVTSQSVHELRFIVKRLFAALVEHLVSEDMRYKSHVLAARGL